MYLKIFLLSCKFALSHLDLPALGTVWAGIVRMCCVQDVPFDMLNILVLSPLEFNESKSPSTRPVLWMACPSVVTAKIPLKEFFNVSETMFSIFIPPVLHELRAAMLHWVMGFFNVGTGGQEEPESHLPAADLWP